MSSLVWQQLNFKNSELKILYSIIGSELGSGCYDKIRVVPIL